MFKSDQPERLLRSQRVVRERVFDIEISSKHLMEKIQNCRWKKSKIAGEKKMLRLIEESKISD
jgi:hypothetical protein